jgi:hypothetical protein
MRPRYFWYLVETLQPEGNTKRLSTEERRAIIDMLDGNDMGGFW